MQIFNRLQPLAFPLATKLELFFGIFCRQTTCGILLKYLIIWFSNISLKFPVPCMETQLIRVGSSDF